MENKVVRPILFRLVGSTFPLTFPQLGFVSPTPCPTVTLKPSYGRSVGREFSRRFGATQRPLLLYVPFRSLASQTVPICVATEVRGSRVLFFVDIRCPIPLWSPATHKDERQDLVLAHYSCGGSCQCSICFARRNSSCSTPNLGAHGSPFQVSNVCITSTRNIEIPAYACHRTV